MERRGRGRPPGSKDSGPRHYRRKTDFTGNDTGMLSVEDKLRQLTHPERVNAYAEISGLSAATIRKKVEQGKIPAFVKSGMTLIEPKDFLTYWLQGRNAA
jgi:hypothetical protein